MKHLVVSIAAAALVVAAVSLAGARTHAQAPTGFTELARQSRAQIDGTIRVAGFKDDVEVVRDEWGVPHIYAKNIDDLFMAEGFVLAQDRLWQMELGRRLAEGRLSELVGADG